MCALPWALVTKILVIYMKRAKNRGGEQFALLVKKNAPRVARPANRGGELRMAYAVCDASRVSPRYCTVT